MDFGVRLGRLCLVVHFGWLQVSAKVTLVKKH